MTAIAAFVPDLMDRSRVAAAAPGAVFVASPAELVDLGAELVVVDLHRPGVLEVIPLLEGRTIGFASHVARELLESARTAGCDEVLPRSEFFRRLPLLFDSPR
jgi:hypothetical protein